MNDLRTLLRDATDHPVPDHFDADLLLRTGKSRVRRRRVAALGAAAAVVAVVAAVPFALAGGDGPQAGPVQEPGLRLGDAVQAVPGEDYTVVRTFDASSKDQSLSGELVRGVLPDGTIVVDVHEGDIDKPGQVALVRRDGTFESLSSRPADSGNFLGATGRTLLFGSNTDGLWTLDRDNQRWSRVQPGDTVVNGNTPAEPFYPSHATPAEVAGLLDDGNLVGWSGDVVATTPGADRPTGRISVTDRATGRTTSFDPGTDCLPRRLGVTPERVVVLGVSCSDRPGDSDYSDVVDHVLVFDRAGKRTATIGGPELGPVRVTDRFVTISSRARGEAGTYVYDLGRGRLLKVQDGDSYLLGDETGSGDYLAWQRSTGEGSASYVVARMH